MIPLCIRKITSWAKGIAQVVECLLGKHEPLGLISSTTKIHTYIKLMLMEKFSALTSCVFLFTDLVIQPILIELLP
jgi:hypothetical protein